ncbi:MAG: hypothetical protein D3922_03210 [Candidatus Electrothrix sp. AR1]|nr:hypothetical protein [Candidatus Electrothrix sp. AR1]
MTIFTVHIQQTGKQEAAGFMNYLTLTIFNKKSYYILFQFFFKPNFIFVRNDSPFCAAHYETLYQKELFLISAILLNYINNSSSKYHTL